MEVTERVPLTNKDDKVMKLTLDTDTRVIKVDCPALWGKLPEFDFTTLSERINRLQETLVPNE